MPFKWIERQLFIGITTQDHDIVEDEVGEERSFLAIGIKRSNHLKISTKEQISSQLFCTSHTLRSACETYANKTFTALHVNCDVLVSRWFHVSRKLNLQPSYQQRPLHWFQVYNVQVFICINKTS